MAVVVYAESLGGKIKKAAREAVTYGAQLAEKLGTECFALTIGEAEGAESLGLQGASKVYNVAGVSSFDAQVYAKLIEQAASQLNADVVITAHTSTGKSLAGRVAVRLGAGLVSAANTMVELDGSDFVVKKNVFSGKGIAIYKIVTAKKVISVAGNTFRPQNTGSEQAVETLALEVPASRIRVKATKLSEGGIPLPEAEIVVSAGRGMKGPENWGIIEDLAKILDAATACSRPVADVDWRPHHEHVGQTGVAIKPTLYFAIGISGAIQHLAGVNQSKVIVVINKDPEAPFFKAADYGIVGDLFDVVPKLNESLKKFKASH